MRYFITLLGCIYLSACTLPGTKQAQPPQTLDKKYPVSVAPPQAQKAEIDPHVKFNRKFLEKIHQVSDPDTRMYYAAGIHELHSLAQRESRNREILEKLVQHQDQTLEIFQICGSEKHSGRGFDWDSLYHSLFWKRSDKSYLVLLICGTGTSNARFVPFLYTENNGEAKFKTLKLTRFRRNSNGTVQRFESEVGFGRTFPNSDQWFNPATEELRIWTRLSGGAKPCGTKGTYRLQNNEFVLQEFTARFECDFTKKGGYEKFYP